MSTYISLEANPNGKDIEVSYCSKTDCYKISKNGVIDESKKIVFQKEWVEINPTFWVKKELTFYDKEVEYNNSCMAEQQHKKMSTYILQKDWIMPDPNMKNSTIIKAGTELTTDWPNRVYKIPQGYGFNYEVVENTPEWFKKKDQEETNGSQWNPVEKNWQPREENKLMPNHFFDQRPLNESVLSTGKEAKDNPDFDESLKGYMANPPLKMEYIVAYDPINKATTDITNEPRISIRAQYIWVKERVLLLQQAMQRNGFQNCEEWIKEWNEHVNWLMNAKKPGASK